MSFSLSDIVGALRASLPAGLRNLDIQGACDQWIDNEDALLAPDQFARFRGIYKMRRRGRPEGIGDRIV